MPQELYNELCRRAEAASRAYYEKDEPIMSDQEYDGIVRQIEELEKQNPSLKKPDSPTVTVGGRATELFAKAQHPKKVLSLKNAYNQADVDAFCASVEAAKSDQDVIWYSVQPKYDGLTLMCKYVNGVFVQAVTRGNGLVGEDVTQNARHIIGLPTRLRNDMTTSGTTIWARGEVLMYKQDFEELNKRLEANGQPKMVNERNAAAGSLRQKNPQVTWNRKLHIVFYDMAVTGQDGDIPFDTEYDMIIRMHQLGFPSVFSHAFHCHKMRASSPICSSVPASLAGLSISDVSSVIASVNIAVSWLWANRDELPFKIDGAVIKAESKSIQAALGNGEKFPKWAVAYKFEAPVYETTLRDVSWDVGRTGRVTPVAHFDPVIIDGTSVSFATLNNPDYIRCSLGGLHKDDTITVFKAAEIIPQVGDVVEQGNGELFVTPDKCPVCQSKLDMDGANLVCRNGLCPGILAARIIYFCSKPCMDIMGLGETIIRELVNRRIITYPSDLYYLRKEDLMKVPRVSEQVADKLMQAIAFSKDMPFDRVLCSLGYRNVGTVASRRLTERFPTYDILCLLTVDDLATVPGIGKNKAKEIWEDINSLENDNIVQQLKDAGLKFACDKPAEQQDATLEGKGFCFTGKLSHPRDWYRTFVSSHGGQFKEGVTGSLDYLVAGEGGGSKRSKAVALHIPIITEEQLMEMVNGNGSSGT